ncbi:MAG TPA: hypothetical protein DCX27_19625 [Balneola sp.]|nr:hypothetical protein [Balneola sp.]
MLRCTGCWVTGNKKYFNRFTRSPRSTIWYYLIGCELQSV